MGKSDSIHFGKFLLTNLNVAINQDELDWDQIMKSYDKYNEDQEIKLKTGLADVHRPGLMYINWVVADYFKFDSLLLMESKTRKREWLKARQIMQYIAITVFKYTLAKVGEFYGQGHDTMLNSKRRVQNLVDTEPDYRQDVTNLIIKLTKEKHGEEIKRDSSVGEPVSVQEQTGS